MTPKEKNQILNGLISNGLRHLEQLIGPVDRPKCGGYESVKVSGAAARCTEAPISNR